MKFKTLGNRNAPAVLFFHAMGVTGESSEPVANYLQDRYFCILPTSTVYCKGQKYVSKADEVRQVEAYLKSQGVERLELVVASSIGADLAMAFLTGTKLPIGHVFFDGGQFAQIAKGTRRIMTPFLYFAIKSLYWSKGGTLKKILWCDDDSIKPYFIAAGENLTYTNLRRHILDSLEDKPFPALPEELQKHIYFEFGSIEDHFKYRQTVMEAYPRGHYPVFEGYDHMQYQIRDPKGFAEMLAYADAVLVRKRFQCADVLVVTGVHTAALVAGAHFLQGVNDYQPGIRIVMNKVHNLFLQSLSDTLAFGLQNQLFWRILAAHKPEQTVL